MERQIPQKVQNGNWVELSGDNCNPLRTSGIIGRDHSNVLEFEGTEESLIMIYEKKRQIE